MVVKKYAADFLVAGSYFGTHTFKFKGYYNSIKLNSSCSSITLYDCFVDLQVQRVREDSNVVCPKGIDRT